MKLSELRARDPIAGSSHLATKHGWSIDLEGELVTAVKGAHTYLIPISNVVYMRGLDAPPKRLTAA